MININCIIVPVPCVEDTNLISQFRSHTLSQMAVFLINICKFNGCGITFPSLGDLIQHIEDTHIDYDPQVIEQKEQSRPQCIPLSYALRFITDAARKEGGPFIGNSGVELKRKLAIKHHSYSMSSSNRSSTPVASDIEEDEMELSESDDSNDSWTTEEFSSEFIMKYGSRHSGNINGANGNNDKPFACPVPGCKKRYKNVNGIKYHSKNGHKKDGKIRKCFKCHCGKSYKTSQGLKSHANLAHNQSVSETNNSSISPISISVMTSSSASSSLSSLINSPNASICGGDSSSNSSTVSNSNNLSATTITKNNNNNYSLITIKTKPTLVKTHSEFNSASSASVAAITSPPATTATVKMTLPSLMNLGILTPATSPSQQQSQQSIIQSLTINSDDHQQGINGGGIGVVGTGATPLTPISPNMSKNINFITSNEILVTDQT